MEFETASSAVPARIIATTVLVLVAAGCETGPGEEVPVDEAVEGTDVELQVAGTTDQTFIAQLSPLNSDLLDDSPAGTATLEVTGDSLVITVLAEGLPPNMMHLQHFHGFEDGAAARCPTSEADENGDGVVDVTETAPLAGTTMVPFHDEPTNLEIDAQTYPRADSEGAYSYRQAVALEALEAAFEDRFGGGLALQDRVVFIHGVPEGTALPETVQTKAGLPAHVTLPIACGELEPGAESGAAERPGR
ncbi:MAG: hypothetical protein ACOC3J_00255 [Gemmatimonadota bacterium]